jgi:hypothetical protein
MQKSEAAEITAAARRADKEKSEWMRDVLLRAAREMPALSAGKPSYLKGSGRPIGSA